MAIRGNTDEMQSNAQQTRDFGSDFADVLTELKNHVDLFTDYGNPDSPEACINGSANGTLIETFYSLHSDLMVYAEEFSNVGQTIDTSAENINNLNTTYTNNMTYEG